MSAWAKRARCRAQRCARIRVRHLAALGTLTYTYRQHASIVSFVQHHSQVIAAMHIPIVTALAPWLIPWLRGPSSDSTPDTPSLTFAPVLAHAHHYDNASRPTLFMHSAPASAYHRAAVSSSNPQLGPDDVSASIAAQPLSVRTVKQVIRRPRVRPPSIVSWALSARQGRLAAMGKSDGDIWIAPDYLDQSGDWEDVEVLAPDVTDRQTLITLAKMSSNAYVLPDGEDSGEWWPVGDYNATIPIGWEKDADGLRGHVFADSKNETVIIALKGTSAGVLGVGGPTAKNDKYNVSPGTLVCCSAHLDRTISSSRVAALG